MVAGAIALTIFFGAWAVSADVEGRYDELVVTGEDSALVGADQSTSTEKKEWWEKTLLFSCPFH